MSFGFQASATASSVWTSVILPGVSRAYPVGRSVCGSVVLNLLRGIMEAPPVTMMPVTGGTINMMEYLLQGKSARELALASFHFFWLEQTEMT